MSEAKHTPGPWRIVETTHPVTISTWHIAIGQKEIRFFPYKYHFADEAKTCGGYVADAEMHANARLIAAAPDLLDALDLLLNDVGRANSMLGAVKARAAIAKATGGQA